jgi:hypothetical protein
MPLWLLELVADPPPSTPDLDAAPTQADKEEIDRELAELISRLKAAKTGSRNHSLNIIAFQAGRMIGAGALDEAISEGKFLEIAQEIGLTFSESKATIRSGIAAGKKHPWRPFAAQRASPQSRSLLFN